MKKIRFEMPKQAMGSTDLAVKLHGFLMEQLESAYASYLHQLDTNPYALRVEFGQERHIWEICLLTDKAVRHILPVLTELTAVSLRGLDQAIPIQKMEVIHQSDEELVSIFNSPTEETRFRIQFTSPTSFKSQGEYIIFPTVRLLMQSLMQKHTRLNGGEEIDEELLDYITEKARITSYHLKTHYYRIHNHKIPAFKGELTMVIKGAETMRAYVKMLLAFGEYSGIGIKSSLGMGGIRVESN